MHGSCQISPWWLCSGAWLRTEECSLFFPCWDSDPFSIMPSKMRAATLQHSSHLPLLQALEGTGQLSRHDCSASSSYGIQNPDSALHTWEKTSKLSRHHKDAKSSVEATPSSIAVWVPCYSSFVLKLWFYSPFTRVLLILQNQNQKSPHPGSLPRLFLYMCVVLCLCIHVFEFVTMCVCKGQNKTWASSPLALHLTAGNRASC